MNAKARLIVASNRLPITIESTDGEDQVSSSTGGLIRALTPILRKNGGCWIGWPGTDHREGVFQLIRNWCSGEKRNYSFEPVFLTATERETYYRGFSNEIIWPLFHDLQSRCRFDPAYWNGYRNVNTKFAETVEAIANPDDSVWVHDYHLMMVAHALRARGLHNHLAYFHHIPFPTADIFQVLPWRVEILRALMQFNALGFQTNRDRFNFIACLRRYVTGVRVQRAGDTFMVCAEDRCVTVGTYPISIDYDEFAIETRLPSIVAAEETIKTGMADTAVALGIDRLDYTKGIPERLIAFHTFLERNPGLRGNVTLLQIVVPSREEIRQYRELKLEIERLVGEINGKYSTPEWVPVRYFYRSVSRAELIAFYRAARVALVTPLRDGMNLVAKEFCASRIDNRGVLVLSEFAGAADELKCGALLVNPHDIEGVAATMKSAFQMDEREQRVRMANMRNQIQLHDVFHWFRSIEVARAVETFDFERVNELESSATPLLAPPQGGVAAPFQ